MQNYQTDIAVIGAGPVGLFFIFEAGMLKMNCHVIDSLDFIGGQCTALYPEKPIYDIPAHPSISAEDLIKQLEIQAKPFNPQYHLGEQVIGLSRTSSGFKIETSKAKIIEAKAVVIAAGCGAFGPNRPPLANLEEYEGKSVFYMVGRKDDFKGKRIAIAGGGDSAVDWSIVLADVAEKIYFIHRRDKFRAAPESVSRMMKLVESGKVEMVVPYQLERLEGTNGVLQKTIVKTMQGEEKSLDTDVLLPFFGLSMNLGPIADWGLALQKNHITVNPETLETSEKGIFAVGDIATYPKKLKLILCGFSEAAMAAHEIRNIVYPDELFHFEYSTSKAIPQI